MNSELIRMKSELVRMGNELIRMKSELIQMDNELIRMKSELIQMDNELIRILQKKIRKYLVNTTNEVKGGPRKSRFFAQPFLRKKHHPSFSLNLFFLRKKHHPSFY